MTEVNYSIGKFYQDGGYTRYYIAQLTKIEEYPIASFTGEVEGVDVVLIFEIFDYLEEMEAAFIPNGIIRKDFRIYKNKNYQGSYIAPIFKGLGIWNREGRIKLHDFKDELFLIGVELNTSTVSERSYLNITSLFLLTDSILTTLKEYTILEIVEDEGDE